VAVCSSCGHVNPAGAKFCLECGGSFVDAPGRRGEERKTVTVLFCDLSGSTVLGETLDPERLRGLLARYFERMKTIVEYHGGTVEKFIGDAVMAVFGVPTVHEDDALRALRASLEMRAALTDLGLAGRIGVTTGEVVTGTEERLATGDAVNVAARLEQAAPSGEVLIGAPTLELVGEGAVVEAIEPLALKGKQRPVPAYRLVRLLARERRHVGRFVGRQRELAHIGETWARVQSARSCELVTVVGDAGVGKSRLAAEALALTDATIVRGRCLPYGEGITYWPVVEVLKQLDVVPSEPAAASAIRSLLGQTEVATSAEEIAWAVRKVLEEAARARPVIVLFDDIQWAEKTFLDLVEHIALLSSGAPIMVLCLARPELTEDRPSWPGAIRLEPLEEGDVEQLVPEQITGDLRASIKRAAAGNPLFVTEMLAIAREAEGEVRVPPTLLALLTARLDQLEVAERSVLERGAVEGEVFHRGAVQALSDTEAMVTPHLAELVRKQLIAPDAPQIRAEDGFRFRHVLIRDAAYDALPKALRAELHTRFAAWLEERGTELVETEELLGYHLEQACRYRSELGMPTDATLSSAARTRLASAGRRAQLRADYPAAASLLARAAALLLPGEVDIALENDLVETLFAAGKGSEALREADSAARRAQAAGDRVGDLCGRLLQARFRMNLEAEQSSEELASLAGQALPIFEEAGNDPALYVGQIARAHLALNRGRMDEMLDASEKASAYARRAGLPDTRIVWRANARFWGTTSASDLLEWLDEQERTSRSDFLLRNHRAGALAMLGRVDEARGINAEIRAGLTDRGGGPMLGTHLGMFALDVELLAGDPNAAVEVGEEGCRLLDELGEKGFLSTTAGNLSRALYAVGRHDEAEAWADRAAQFGASDDIITQMLWRQVRAKLLALRGENEEAKRLGREALALAETTDMLDCQGDTHADVGEVFLLCGETDSAAAALEQAVGRYTRKGNVVSAARAKTRLEAIQQGMAIT
jgi:class 3 adenylate cyclase/tetratricopeptide (TPR) repeat protein